MIEVIFEHGEYYRKPTNEKFKDMESILIPEKIWLGYVMSKCFTSEYSHRVKVEPGEVVKFGSCHVHGRVQIIGKKCQACQFVDAFNSFQSK